MTLPEKYSLKNCHELIYPEAVLKALAEDMTSPWRIAVAVSGGGT